MSVRRILLALALPFLAAAAYAQSFSESYVLASNGNTVALPSGGTILFSPTLINTSASAGVNITNTGTGVGQVTGISISGAAFSLTNVPATPLSVAGGQTVQLQLHYQPTSVATDSGQLQISFGSGSSVTFALQGSGSSATLAYQVVQPATTVAPGGTITFPSTNLGQTSTLVIKVTNTGNASGTVNNITVSGAGFGATSVPPLPQTLAPNGSLTFTITFTPTTPNTLTGSLIVNSDLINLSGVGLGPQLQFSYITAGTVITLNSTNTSVIFSPVAVTQSEQLVFDVKNTGTSTAVISNIGPGQANGPYAITGIPGLPVKVAPGNDFKFTIIFTPVTVGFINGTLQLDSTVIPLVGSGTAPPVLSAYTIAGPSGTTSPASQPLIGLTLASAYPVALSGTLTIGVAGTLPVDPAVQFATGGKTIAFTIPANSTQAQFGSLGTQVGLQTGTVASTVTLTPAFATQAGGIDLTPASPSTLQFQIAPAAPTLVSVQLANTSATGFSLQVTGFSTPRQLNSLSVQFNPAAGFSLPVTQFTINLQQIASLWFGGTASDSFGGQFTVTVPFTFQGLPTGKTPLTILSSVAVTASNSNGTSNSVQVNTQ